MLLWLAAGFATVLMITWPDTLTIRAKEIRTVLAALSSDDPSLKRQRQEPQAGTFYDSLLSDIAPTATQKSQAGANPFDDLYSGLSPTGLSPNQKQHVGADTVLWTESIPNEGTPERIALDSKKRQVRERLARFAQRDETLATGISVMGLGILPVGLLVLTWIWFGRASETQPRKTFRDWHPGKIILLWCIALVVLYALLQSFHPWERTRGLIQGAVLLLPLVVITWKWFTERERGR
ncbi:MAG: hypothetical protein ACREMW_05510 [Gemmatimonadales bacterium]